MPRRAAPRHDAGHGASARYDLVTPAGETITERHDDVTAPRPHARTGAPCSPSRRTSSSRRAPRRAGRGPRRRGARVEAAPHAGARARRAADGSAPARDRAGAAARDRPLVGRGRAAEHSGDLRVHRRTGLVLARARHGHRAVPPPPGADRRLPAWTAVYAAWYVAFLALLGPHLGGLLLPVALYGFVLVRWRRSPAVSAGCRRRRRPVRRLDSVLASRFVPGYEFALHDLVGDVDLLAAQGLIALGVVRDVEAPPRRQRAALGVGCGDGGVDGRPR